MRDLASLENCGQITNADGPFAECLQALAHVNNGALAGRAAELFEFCLYDTCEVSDRPGEVEQLKCDAIAAFKAECEMYGVTPIDWRTQDFCPS